jgi:hypothetical protein
MSGGDLCEPERARIEELRAEARERRRVERAAAARSLAEMEEQEARLREAIEALLDRYPEAPAYVEVSRPLPPSLRRSIEEFLERDRPGDE